MAVVFADTFTDTNGTSLNAHTPDTTPGGGWTEVAGDWSITGNQAVIAVSANNCYSTADVGETDGILTVSGKMSSTSAALTRITGAVFRWQSAGNYWVAGFLLGTNTLYIAQFISGVPTVRASDATLSLSAGVMYTVEVTLSGDDISAKIDGAHEITYNSSVGNTSTIHGFMGRDSGTMAIDNFSFATVGGTDALTANNIAAGSPVLGTSSLFNSADLVTFTDGTGGDVNTATDLLMSAGWPTFNGGVHPDSDVDPFNPQYTLFRFDFSSFLATDTVITAKLYLYSTQGDEGAGTVVPDIYSIAASDSGWIEGTGNIALALAGEPCWNAKVADGAGGVTTAWSGGDGRPAREASRFGTDSWLASAADGSEHVITLDASRIQGWLGASNTNYGIIIIPNGTNNAHVGLSENATAGYRPKLVVEIVVGGPDDLTANNITGGAAVAGSPSIAQTHVITADGIVAGSAIVGSPSIGQTQGLSATGIVAGPAVVGTAAIGQTHVMTAAGVTAGAAAVGTPAIGQTHALSAGNIAAGPAVVGSPSMSGTVELTATNITGGTPVIGTPAIGQIHGFAATNIDAGPGVNGSPSIGQVHSLLASNLFGGPAVVGSPSIGSIYDLFAVDITGGIPVLGEPDISENPITVYNLIADNISAEPAIVGSPRWGRNGFHDESAGRVFYDESAGRRFYWDEWPGPWHWEL